MKQTSNFELNHFTIGNYQTNLSGIKGNEKF